MHPGVRARQFGNVNIEKGESDSQTMEVVGMMHERYVWTNSSTDPAGLFITPHEKVCCPIVLPPLDNVRVLVHHETELASNNTWLFFVTRGTSLASAQKDTILGKSRDCFLYTTQFDTIRISDSRLQSRN